MKNKAKDYFLGKNGKKLNCAQAVSQAYCDIYGFYHQCVDNHCDCGGGRAPQGHCGALHAGGDILALSQEDKVSMLKDFFLKEAGALTCREIKAGQKLSCVDCVTKVAEFLENISVHKK